MLQLRARTTTLPRATDLVVVVVVVVEARLQLVPGRLPSRALLTWSSSSSSSRHDYSWCWRLEALELQHSTTEAATSMPVGRK